MHKDQAAFARKTGNHRIYEDAEWQADTFASNFLMDKQYCSSEDDIYDIQKRFGVSFQAATIWHKRNLR